ncbi:beta-phosphoglucomutase [Paenibacillus pinihumi]|uniref:beta-phosphoglucomutase n=1 Tax=Paenibacillus pinihumi TaxID=669462 RepID=UPI0004051F3A|nr:beta-phosphoglucomutase [Paenibacillus pinihumi]
MSTSNSLQAVIFDLDGVITDTAEYHYQAWKALADELGISFSREFNENLKGVSRIDSLKLLLGQAASPLSLTEEEMVRLADRKNGLYQKLIEQITPADLLPGIPEFIADIRQRGIKVGLASASKNAQFVVNRLEAEDYFDVIVDVTKLKRNKPDPEIFVTAAALLGADPGKCIGVEDAASGVDAIKGAKMFAVAVGREALFPHADIVLPDTSRLRLDDLLRHFD